MGGDRIGHCEKKKVNIQGDAGGKVSILGGDRIGHCEKKVNTQGEAGGKVSILGGDRIGHCEKKKVNMNMCLILNGYRDGAV